MPVKIPQGVEIKLEGKKIFVKGKAGELDFNFAEEIDIKVENDIILILRKNDTKKVRSLHGLTRALVANMVVGASKGFEKKLEINGVGYRAEGGGKSINLSLGFSHPIKMEAPEGISVEIDKDKKNILTIKGIDKQKVGQFAAEIRKLRKPEPYKGKGIKYIDERIIRKAGKKAGSK